MTDLLSSVFMAGASALIASAVGVGLLRRGRRLQLLDLPNERSLHMQPTPKGGGLLIALSIVTALLVASPARGIAPSEAAWILAGATFSVALLSLWDDFHALTWPVRLVLQAAAATLTVAFIGYPTALPTPEGSLELGAFAIPLALFWVVGLTNAYNFMDGIDGIAAVQALVAGVGWAIIGIFAGLPNVAVLGGVIAGASAGFLLHNWSPAKIFMGDVGSITLGFTFAVTTVLAATRDARLFVAGVMLLWPFVFDAGFTLCRRLLNGEHVFKAHRSHLYQRLVIAGLSHATVATIYALLGLVGVVAATLTAIATAGIALAAIVTITASAIGLWLVVTWVERGSLTRQDWPASVSEGLPLAAEPDTLRNESPARRGTK